MMFPREIRDTVSSIVHRTTRVVIRRRRRPLAINVDSLIGVRGAEKSLISMYKRDIIITLYYRLTCAGGLHGSLVWGEGGWTLDGREEVEAGREKTPPNRMPIWLCVPCCIQTTIHGAPSYTLEYSHLTRSRGRRCESSGRKLSARLVVLLPPPLSSSLPSLRYANWAAKPK